jgi:hypothetical protein
MKMCQDTIRVFQQPCMVNFNLLPGASGEMMAHVSKKTSATHQ